MTALDTELIDEDSIEHIDSASTLMALNASEIDTQISTAKKYPRSIKRFVDQARQMVTLTEDIAGDCIYALPRGGKSIEGPSARFAEIVISAWGNCRAGARIVNEDDRFVVAQGVFLDLQHNTALTYEVKRRITDKYGKRFKDDMIGVTSNAACSIALRNAALRGVPKAFWRPLYEEARKTAIGDVKTLATRRASMIEAFGKMGVTPEMLLAHLQVDGEADISLDHLGQLRGIFTALKEGDSTIDQVFRSDDTAPGSKVGRSKLNDEIQDQPPKAEAKPDTQPEPAAGPAETCPRCGAHLSHAEGVGALYDCGTETHEGTVAKVGKNCEQPSGGGKLFDDTDPAAGVGQ